MYGGGSQGYQNDAMFEVAGIKLIPQNFQVARYSQWKSKEFVGGLSIIDPLMNLGFEGTLALLKRSQNPISHN